MTTSPSVTLAGKRQEEGHLLDGWVRATPESAQLSALLVPSPRGPPNPLHPSESPVQTQHFGPPWEVGTSSSEITGGPSSSEESLKRVILGPNLGARVPQIGTSCPRAPPAGERGAQVEVRSQSEGTLGKGRQGPSG